MGLMDTFRGTGRIKRIPGLQGWANTMRFRRQDIIDYWSPDWKRYERNNEFYAGKIFTAEQKRRAKDALKFLLEFNILPTIVNSATGREQINRFRPALKGRDRGAIDEQLAQLLSQEFGINDPMDDPAVAQMLTEAMRWIDQKCDAESELSDAFLDAFICGVGIFNTHWDDLDGIYGKIKTHEVQPWEVGFDPDSKARNFRDASHLVAFRKLPLEEAEHLFPKKSDVLRRAASASRNHILPERVRSKDQRPFYPMDGNRFYSPETNLVLLSNYQVKTREDVWHYEDPVNGIEAMVGLQEWNALKRFWEDEGRSIPAAERREQWVYKSGWMAGDEPLVDDLIENPIQDFTYGAITCYPHKSTRGTRWFSPVDLGKDPQIWSSKFLSLAVDILSAGPKGGVILGPRAFETEADREQFRKEIARPDGVPVVNDMDQIEFAPSPSHPTALGSLAGLASGGIWDAMGLNRLNAGMLDDPRRAPFQTVNAVMQANQSVFAMPFDSLRFARRALGRRYLLFIRDYLPPSVILRAVGHDHAQAVLSLTVQTPEGGFEDEWDTEKFDRALEYDLVSDDAPTTPNQMIALFQIMTNTDMFALLQQSGQAPPLEVLLDMFVAAGLPSSLKEQWIEAIGSVPDPQQKQAVLQELIASLPPDLQQAIEAHFASQSEAA